MSETPPPVAIDVLLELAVGGGLPLTRKTLSICRGDLIAIIGNSGCGKTTLLRGLAATIAGLDTKRSGPVRKNRWTILERAVAQSRLPVAITPQESDSIFPHLTVAGNIAYYQRVAGRREAAAISLGKVGLAAKAETLAGALSGGERRRLSIAIDLALEPAVLAADEPLTALDSPTADLVFDHVLQPYAREHAVLFSVHAPLDRWLEACTQVWVMAPDESGGPGDVVYAGTGADFVSAARTVGADTGTPAAHAVLTHLTEFLRRSFAGQEWAPPLPTRAVSQTVPPRGRPVSRLGLFGHVLGHELRTQLSPRLKSPGYWVGQLCSVGIVFLANFLLAADRLPFSVPLASISVLVTALFLSMVMTSRLWVDSEGANIRHQFLRGVPPSITISAKTIPTFVEVVLLSLLVLAGRWLMTDASPFHVRASAFSQAAPAGGGGWPDNYATLLAAPWLPAVVPMIIYVGFVGGLQGVFVSLFVALRQQREGRVRRAGIVRVNGGSGMVQASSVAITLVVVQITVSGAFGQVAADRFARSFEALPGNFTDLLGSLSPLRWGYNWVLVAEYRRARCGWSKLQCDQHDATVRPAYLNNRCLRLATPDGTQTPQATDPEKGDNWYACSPEESGNYIQTRSELLVDWKRREALFESAGLPVPLESMADRYTASRFADYERTRREKAVSSPAASCDLQRALLSYENSLSGILVSRAMFRPGWIDAEFCLRRCPAADWQRGESFAECDTGSDKVRLDPPLRYPITGRILEETGAIPAISAFPCSHDRHASPSGGTPSAATIVEGARADRARLAGLVQGQVNTLCSGESESGDRLLLGTMGITGLLWILLDIFLLRRWYRGLQRV